MGRQAPLGFRGNRPAELRTENSANDGAPTMRRQVVGNVNAESIDLEADHLVEGRDDISVSRPAPRRQTTNGVRRRNVHLGFGPDSNDPSTRFANIVRGYEAMDGLTEAITQYFATPHQAVPRRMIDITREYAETVVLLENANREEDREFYRAQLRHLNEERQQLSFPASDGNGAIQNEDSL